MYTLVCSTPLMVSTSSLTGLTCTLSRVPLTRVRLKGPTLLSVLLTKVF